jgi:hypothetical protein
MGVEPGEGVEPKLLKGGFDAVRREIKRVGREGWSAGQVLEQVRRRYPAIELRLCCFERERGDMRNVLTKAVGARRDHTPPWDRAGAKVSREHGHCRMRQSPE